MAPIALHPDPLLAQVLAASTYPLEIVQLQQWLAKNPALKDKALADAVARNVGPERAVHGCIAGPREASWPTTFSGRPILAMRSLRSRRT